MSYRSGQGAGRKLYHSLKTSKSSVTTKHQSYELSGDPDRDEAEPASYSKAACDRANLRATGWTEEDFTKPVITVGVPYSNGLPCNNRVRELGDVIVEETACARLPIFATLEEAKLAFPDINAAVVSTPPEFSQEYIRLALELGLHVFAEKPPGRDHEALANLQVLAGTKNPSLFTGYHSTVAPAIEKARVWLDMHKLKEVTITWKEAANKWHRGQSWVTRAEGYGVLDALFNALSVVDELLVGPDIVYSKSTLYVPGNWTSPIAGETTMMWGDCPIRASYDWNCPLGEIWTIAFTGEDGIKMELRDGGAQMYVRDIRVTSESTPIDVLRPEYEELYGIFLQLMERNESLVRLTPLWLVNQILLSGTVETIDDYDIFGSS